MIQEDTAPAGTYVKFDKRTHRHNDVKFNHSHYGHALPQWGLVVEWQLSDYKARWHKARILWNTGDVTVEQAWTLCVHKSLERRRRKLNE